MTESRWATEIAAGRRQLMAVLIGVLALHAAMIWYDLGNPDVFLNADRAASRLDVIQRLLAAMAQGRTLEFLSSHGAPGDYAIHALLYAAGGRVAIIVVQVGLVLATGFAVYRVGRLMGLSAGYSSLATAVYLLLPHTVLFPHQLAAEALHVPLIVLTLWMLAEFLYSQTADRNASRHHSYLLLAAVFAGLSILVRPVSLLWPLLIGLLMLKAVPKVAVLAFLAIAYSLVLSWMGLMHYQTGEFGMGKADHDAGHNLYRRVAFIAETMEPDSRHEAKLKYLDQGPRGSLSAIEYLHFGVEYPGPFIKQGVRDSMVFFGKSGIERILIDYLDLIDAEARKQLQDRSAGWRVRWEQEGPVAALSYLWRIGGLVLVLSLIGSVAILSLVALAGFGAWSRLAHGRSLGAPGLVLTWLLVSLPFYLLLFSAVADGVQSRYRAQAEAALVLLAIWGLSALRRQHRFGQTPLPVTLSTQK